MKDLSRTMRLAGVDIGTLTCRLLIADLSPGGRLIEVRSERRILAWARTSIRQSC
jgi:exopolyphosphatase/guanosine-5'-triphosphate,3'-diphosphate pyrophosphatase